MKNDSFLSKFLDKLQRKIEKETEVSLPLEVHTQEADKTIIENQYQTFDSIARQKELPQIFLPTETKNPQIAQCSTNLISFHSSKLCPYCSIYNQRVFSIDGKDNKYPSFDILPQDLKCNQCPECHTFIGFSSVYYISNKEALQDQKFSNRPFVDSRTKEEKEIYNTEKQNKLQQQKDKQDYDWLIINLPDICPKSFGAYRKMSNAKSTKYQQLIIAAKDKGYEI